MHDSPQLKCRSPKELSWAGLVILSFILSQRPHVKVRKEGCHTIDVCHSLHGERAELMGMGWADLTCLCQVPAVHQLNMCTGTDILQPSPAVDRPSPFQIGIVFASDTLFDCMQREVHP